MAGTCPEDLKPIMGRYLSRAQQFDSLAAKRDGTGAERVAYHCRVKALNMATTKGRDALSSPENAAFVGALMDQVESQKSALGITPESAATDAEHAKTFAMRFFNAAEKDVATSSVDAKTASRYWNAATMFDVVESIAGTVEDDVAARNLYAEQMTREVTAAVREGRPVVPQPLPAGVAGSGEPAPMPPAAPPSSYPPSAPSSAGAPPAAYPPASSAPPPTAAPGGPPAYPGAHAPAAGPPSYFPPSSSSGYPGATGYPPTSAPGGGAHHHGGTAASSGYGAPAANAGFAPHAGFPPATSAAAASAAPAPAVPSGPVSLLEYVPVAGACWSKEVIAATRECSLAATLLRADDIYGAQQHLEKALMQVKQKISGHEKEGGSAKRL